MIIVVPVGGTGERFKEMGYQTPKALIKALGKPMLFWLLDSVLDNLPEDLEAILIPYSHQYQSYRFEDLIRKRYPHLPFVFHPLHSSTRGAVETVSSAFNSFDVQDQPVVLKVQGGSMGL